MPLVVMHVPFFASGPLMAGERSGNAGHASSSLPASLAGIPLIPHSVVACLPIIGGAAAASASPSGGTKGTPISSIIPVTCEKDKTLPFKVASSIVPIPAKLVRCSRIRRHEGITSDNVALAERLAALPPGLAPPKPPGEREIGGEKALVTWVSSFSTYVAVVSLKHPERVADMLAYMRLMIREASKFGGNG